MSACMEAWAVQLLQRLFLAVDCSEPQLPVQLKDKFIDMIHYINFIGVPNQASPKFYT